MDGVATVAKGNRRKAAAAEAGRLCKNLTGERGGKKIVTFAFEIVSLLLGGTKI